MDDLNCRFCEAPLNHVVVDLGVSPVSNNFLRPEDLNEGETHYPIRVYVCEECYLVQLPAIVPADQIFDDSYAYFSSYSRSWLEHAARYTQHMRSDYGIGDDDFVIEVGSNDGYLLRNFMETDVSVLGIDPCQNVAEAARSVGVPTREEFVGAESAARCVEEHGRADLLIGNNVLAHVPDLNDFVTGLRRLLAQDGILTMEFPHLKRLLEENQFDTIYHEHFSYFSFTTVRRVFAEHGLEIFDVAQLRTHGGSLRIYAQHAECSQYAESKRVQDLLQEEREFGMTDLETYRSFGERVQTIRRDLLDFLIETQRQGETVVGYGAPAKGNTLLNYCGIRSDFLPYTVDRSHYKQGRFLPGTRIPVHAPERIFETEPDYVLILPWNLQSEIVRQMCGIADWGGQFVVPIPSLRFIRPTSRHPEPGPHHLEVSEKETKTKPLPA